MNGAQALFPDHASKITAMGSHHSANALTHTWLTPPHILEALGPFDLDPCAGPVPRPWSTATHHWGRSDNSLNRPWFGRVWLNPPYGLRSSIAPWMSRLAEHGNGIALIFARTETTVFFDTVWQHAASVFFLRGRLSFYRADGTLPRSDQGGGNAGAPSVLVAYGEENSQRLRTCGLAGKFLEITP